MSEIRLFENGEFELRISAVGDSFTVQAPELARALGFHAAKDLIRTIPDDEKGWELSPTPGGEQWLWVLTEPGLYRAIGQRQAARVKNQAMREQVTRFQNWVYKVVLPSIRKTGGYQVQQAPVARQPFGLNIMQPDVLNYDEICGLMRQHCGVSVSVNELTRYLRACGVLKQNGAPSKKFAHLFWFTGSSWNVPTHLFPQVAYKVCEIGRELQDFRFLQMRLELDGVGRPPEMTQHQIPHQ